MKKGDRYIVRKYVMAKSAMEAINKEPKIPVHDVWIDEDYKEKGSLNSCIGFMAEGGDDEDE